MMSFHDYKPDTQRAFLVKSGKWSDIFLELREKVLKKV